MRVEIPSFDHLPQRVSRLGELAYNIWWSWNAEARRLFRNLDHTLWRQTSQNPVRMLVEISQERLAEVACDLAFVESYDRVIADYDNYMTKFDTWYNRTYQDRVDELIAYFCAEFAVHTSVPIYSGGLGLLAGDTCKEASDLGIPFVAVGAFYPEGYFRQRIAADGSQESHYERLEIANSPLLRVCKDDGSNLIVDIPLDGRVVRVAVWRLQIGRVPVYLMDTDIDENEPWDRDLVARLYGGDSEMRLRQEIILGIGGTRVLRALGYDPGVFHLNEGHAAFAALELIREGRTKGLNYAESLSAARQKLVFTTHTPVQAGHDEFPFYMMEEHFRHFWESISISREEFLALGTAPGGQTYSMTVLALRMAREANGVSAKHGEVSRSMWHHLFPDRTVEQVPIKSITNGVHVPTWASRGLAGLLKQYFGPDWRERYDEPGFWDRIL
ncbi:MAG: alpha-glucan family phosphorylase, partial [Acidobacteriota bacterium]